MVNFIFSIFWILFNLVLPRQDDPLHTRINNLLANFSWNHPDEKVYIHTDKSVYFPGEDLWMKAYLMIGPYHIPDTLSNVLYVELIDPEGVMIDRKILRMREGLGWGDFRLPVGMDAGDYLVKAYTRYMQNFDPAFHFRKKIRILDGNPMIQESRAAKSKRTGSSTGEKFSENLKLQFFPEGGHLVTGLQSHIAFKAVESSGTGKKVNGIIRNSRGDTVEILESSKFGMGKFILRPGPGESYHSLINGDSTEYRFDLPQPLEKGFVMHINQHDDKVYIWVRNNFGARMDHSFVIGQFRGFPFITIHGKEDQDFLYTVLNTREMPSGIIHFTFIDSLGIPQCERLVYSENEKERIDFSISSDKKTYKKRQEAIFNIHCSDQEGNYILTNLSLAVVNSALFKEDNGSHIRSFFNLESDIRGFIEEPGYYFNPANEDRYEILDLLLLTQGWRKFVWKELLDGRIPEYEFPPEPGFAIEGKLLDFYNREKTRSGNVRLFIYQNQFYYNELETDDSGQFSFQGLTLFDSTQVVIQAWQDVEGKGKGKDRTRNDYAFSIFSRPYAVIDQRNWPPSPILEDSYADYVDLHNKILKIDSSFEGRTIILDELTVTDSKIDPDDAFARPGKLYREPSRRIIMDSLMQEEESLLLFDILRKYFPGVRINGMPPDVEIIIRGPRSLEGDNSAMLFLDGNPVESGFLYYFPASEIDFIDLLTANKAAVYGNDAVNGAIAFYSKQGPPEIKEEERMGMINFTRNGYYRARQFYSPDYGTPEEKYIKPDYRRTLYWNPSLTTDELGNIEFSFYTSDESARYRIDIEGMTYSGIPFTSNYYFEVE